MLRPFLFVGCGGSGVKTVRLLRQAVELQLRSRGYEGPLPESWQFLAIDVPAVEDSPSDLLAVPGVTYVGLSDPHSTYKGSNGADARLMGNPISRDEFHKWRPDPEGVHTNIVVGAGQQRAVGRVVASVFNSKVAPKIKQAVDRCTSTRADLLQLGGQLNYHARTGEQPAQPIVVVVSSLGGGAGSGIFLDVADMLRMSAQANNSWLQNNLYGILYDPSVFDRDGSVQESGIAPNSLAAVSELVAGQWEPWDRSPLLSDFQGELGNYAGIEYPFLVGSTNGSIIYSNPIDVYRATAQALGAWVLDPDLASEIESFGAGNWSSKSAKSSLPLHGGAGTRMPLSSLGFARVGLGRRQFGTYAEERMSREAIERLLTRHHTQAVRDGLQSDAEAAAERVSAGGGELVVQTLRECGLDEHTDPATFAEPDVNRLDAGSNQILEAIRDIQGVVASITSLCENVSGAMDDPKKLAGQVTRAAKEYFEGEPEKFMERHKSRAITWAAQIQPRVIDGVLRLIATEGLPVATLVVQEMIKRVGSDFPDQLLSEIIVIDKFDRWNGVDSELGKVKARGNAVPQTARDIASALVESFALTKLEKDLRKIVAPVLQDFAKGFLTPLHREMVNALASARAEMTQESFRQLAGEVVPSRLRPAPNEKLLDSVDSFPKLYLDLLRQTAESVESALSTVVQGLYGSDRSRTRAPEDALPVKSTPWVPAIVQQMGTGSVAATATFELRLSSSQIRRRASYWMSSDVQTPIGRFMRTSLREYLADPLLTDAERNKRAKEFARELDLALDCAKPLTELANQWVANSFNVSFSDSFEFSLSTIPLAPGDNGYDEASNVLRKRLNRLDVSSMLASGTRDDIEIFAMMKPLGASAFATLVYPVTQAWGSEIASFPRGNGTFWRHRRARPLLQALPLTPAVKATLARGWTTGLLLGLIDWDDDEGGITIASADGKRYSFLQPALSGIPAETKDQFGSVLEGVMLAEFLAAAGQDDPLSALEELLKLGNSFGRPEASLDYAKLNPLLLAMINEAGEGAAALAGELAENLRQDADALEQEEAAELGRRDNLCLPLGTQTAELQSRAMRDLAVRLDGAWRVPASGPQRRRTS